MRAKSERVYKPGAKEEWRVVYWIYPQERVKNNRKQVSFSSLKYGDSTAQLKAWAVIRFINHFGCVPEDIKNPPLSLPPCCSSCYPHCLKEHVPGCSNCIDPPTDRHFLAPPPLGPPPSGGGALLGSPSGGPAALGPPGGGPSCGRLRHIAGAPEARSPATDALGDDVSEEGYDSLHPAGAPADDQGEGGGPLTGAPPAGWLSDAAAAAAAARQGFQQQQRELQLRGSPADTVMLSEASPDVGVLPTAGSNSSSGRFLAPPSGDFLLPASGASQGGGTSSKAFLRGPAPQTNLAFQPLPPAAVAAAPLTSESFFAATQELSAAAAAGEQGGLSLIHI